ncbi:hypothetical protein NC651_001559 [Populus alba x Populus x berolinensis]|nr:hypothetical protein NC651_001559 [Populus alba x Populus x berolinensis]
MKGLSLETDSLSKLSKTVNHGCQRDRHSRSNT